MSLGKKESRTRTTSAAEKNTPSSSRVRRQNFGRVVDEKETKAVLDQVTHFLAQGNRFDAKRALWKILRIDPNNHKILQKLREIDREELKELLCRPEPATDPKKESLVEGVETASTWKNLDHEFQLGLEEPSTRQFFENENQKLSFEKSLNKKLKDLRFSDRLDLGVGFLEMEFFDFALICFDSVLEGFSTTEPTESPSLWVWSALSLASWSLLCLRRPQDVIGRIKSFDRHLVHLEESQQVHFYYLLGRAAEQLQEPKEALTWYRRVVEGCPSYRDTDSRLYSLLKQMGNL